MKPLRRDPFPHRGSRTSEKPGFSVPQEDPDTTIHAVERLWRTEPHRQAELVLRLGVLLFETGDYERALRLLERWTAAGRSDAELEGLLILTLLELQRDWAAMARLENALRHFAIHPRSRLRQAADAALARPELNLQGWVGLDPKLRLCGCIRSSAAPPPLQVFDSHGKRIRTVPQFKSAGDAVAFQFAIPPMPATRLRVNAGTDELLGSGLAFPPNADLDGRAWSIGRSKLTGWVRCGWDPTRPIKLVIEDETGKKVRVIAQPPDYPGARRRFELDHRQAGIKGSRIQLSATLPDGGLQALPDTPLLVGRAVPRYVARRTPVSGRRRYEGSTAERAPLCVIIPVYRGLEDTLNCIASVLGTRSPEIEVLVIDDATPDPMIAKVLDDYASQGQIRLLRNGTNLGFVGSINRALSATAGKDVVLLNSDTCVFGDWLHRLQNAAYAADDIGTVTPFSDDGTIVSYPLHQTHPPTRESAQAFDQAVRTRFAEVRIEIPVGVGFCMYIRNDCLAQTGRLDESLFGKGYGEESDFCMRARALGWRHILAADCYVHHAGGRSFGNRRAALLDRARRLLNLRHPDYDRYVSGFIARDPIAPLRRQLDESVILASGRSVVLLVSLPATGGVDRYVYERSRKIAAEGKLPLVLVPKEGRLDRQMMLSHGLPIQHLIYDLPQDLDTLSDFLKRLPIEHVELHHFLDVDLTVLDRVRALDAPCDIYVHDYLWICPRVTLIDRSGRYCGEPSVSVCEVCIRQNGSRLTPKMTVRALRHRSARWLESARRVIVPTQDVAARLGRYFPKIKFDIVPAQTVMSGLIARDSQSNEWLSDTRGGAAAAAQGPAPRRALRVATIGAIGRHKGYDVLLRCAKDAAARKLPIEFVVVGFTKNDDKLIDTGKVRITGRYEDGEARDLLGRERPDWVFLASVWPETWCYTLTEALNAGLRIVAFDLGGIAERLRAAGLGDLLPLQTSAKALNNFFLGSAEALTRQSAAKW